jgi:hypothetical protein
MIASAPNPLAGKPAPASLLVNVQALIKKILRGTGESK